MSRPLLLLICVFFFNNLFGQENLEITKRLKDKYGYASYNEDYNFYYVGYGSYPANGTGKQGVCDQKGAEIIPPKYDGISRVDNLIYHTNFNGVYGIYTILGKELSEPKWFGVVGDEKTGFCRVFDGKIGQNGTHEGIYNQQRQIIPCEYEDIILPSDVFGHKDVIVLRKNDLYGLTDLEGKLLLACEYSKIDVIDSLGLAIVSKGGQRNKANYWSNPFNAKWGIVDIKGQQIVPCEYDYIGKCSERIFLCNKGCVISEETPFKPEGGLYGYLDIKGNLLFPCKYTEATDFEDGIAQVSLDGVTSMITNPLTGTNMNMTNGGSTIKVDMNIPESGKKSDNTFAFIIANENYTKFKGADFSINDGKVFKEYCIKTFGISEKNIRYYEDATYGNIVAAVKRMKDIADVYEGDAKIIFYYSGLGTSDTNHDSYILPVDASPDALSNTAYNVSELMTTLNALNTKATIVILDAPFSGSDKNGKMLAQHRGVQIVPKPVSAIGNTIICISSEKTETAYSDKKFGHSLFSYALMEKIQDTKGNCSVKDALDYAASWTKKEAMNEYDATQTPHIIVSNTSSNNWNNLKW